MRQRRCRRGRMRSSPTCVRRLRWPTRRGPDPSARSPIRSKWPTTKRSRAYSRHGPSASRRIKRLSIRRRISRTARSITGTCAPLIGDDRPVVADAGVAGAGRAGAAAEQSRAGRHRSASGDGERRLAGRRRELAGHRAAHRARLSIKRRRGAVHQEGRPRPLARCRPAGLGRRAPVHAVDGRERRRPLVYRRRRGVLERARTEWRANRRDSPRTGITARRSGVRSPGISPPSGEQVGFFVTAGDARAKDVRAVTERSNVVMVPFPSDGGAYYPF